MPALCLGEAIVDLVCEHPVASLAAAAAAVLPEAVAVAARVTEQWGAVG